MIYLQGQKDQAEAQAEAQRQAVAVLTERYNQLKSELNTLEGKQFAGLDRPSMEAQLVELSARYEEAAHGSSGTAELDTQLLALSQKLAQRRAEQYQPKFTQKIAQANARVQELGKQYQRENQIMKAFVPGISCPTCRRPVTEENLPKVREAIQLAINNIVANGRSQRIQVAQLQEQEAKNQTVFDQFQAEDIIKMQDEIDALTRQRDKLAKDGQADKLREQIQQLSAGLEYSNLSQQEYDRLRACRDELRQCAAELATAKKNAEQEQPDFDAQIAQARQKVKALTVLISNVVIYARKRTTWPTCGPPGRSSWTSASMALPWRCGRCGPFPLRQSRRPPDSQTEG